MPAPIGPDENQPTQDPGSPEHQAFVYDDSNPIESQSYETEYVPEREFVLMPLFRRIGDLLGIRRREQSQPPYEAEPLSSEVKPDFPAFAGEPPAANAIEEHASSLVPDPVTMQAIQTPAAADTQDGLTAQSQAEPEEEDVVQIEHEAAEAASLSAQEWVQAQEFPAHADEPEAQVVAQFGAAEPTEVDAISENRFEDTAVEQMPVEPPAEAVEANMAPPHRNVVANRREAETSELIASLREATAKIANAISDAAQWLHSKEE